MPWTDEALKKLQQEGKIRGVSAQAGAKPSDGETVLAAYIAALEPPKDEHELQARVVEWWDAWAPAMGFDPLDLFAIPNGGARHAAVGAKLKAEGVRAGIPDMMLARPMIRGTHMLFGLFIEHKMPGNGLTEKQSAAANRLAKQGYRVVVSFSVEQTKLAILDYLDMENRHARNEQQSPG